MSRPVTPAGSTNTPSNMTGGATNGVPIMKPPIPQKRKITRNELSDNEESSLKASRRSTETTPHDTQVATLRPGAPPVPPPDITGPYAGIRIEWNRRPEPMASFHTRVRIKYNATRIKHDPAQLTPGTVIRALHYEQDFDQSPITPTTPGTANRFKGPKGPVNVKERKMLIVSNHPDHYIALPLFTHSGRGIKHLPPDERAQYLSVCDHRAVSKHEPQNPLPVLYTEYMDVKTSFVHPRSCVNYAFPTSYYYKQRVVVEGYLTKDSLITLENFYHCRSGRPFTPTTVQVLEHAHRLDREMRELRQRRSGRGLTPPVELESPTGWGVKR